METFRAGRRSAHARFAAGPGRGVRRTTLQAALRERAAQAGIAWVAGRVAGLRQDAHGVEAAGVRARWLVGADGLHSRVRREAGIASALSHIADRHLENLRIHPEDARVLLTALQPRSLERVFLLFPDPWPKRRTAKRRFVNRGNLDRLAELIVPGGELRIAWQGEGSPVMMTGPAVTVYEGEWPR